MERTSCCLTLLIYCVFELQAAILNIHPNKSQFFWYDSVTLSCVVGGNSSDWTLKRNTSNQISEPCAAEWGVLHKSSCKIEDAYPSDSGVYWCESELGESSNTINVNITDGAVILEIPALAVNEGQKVTLFCHYKKEPNHKPTTDFSANFYKDGVFIGTAGNITFSSVSKVDEGFYNCEHPTKGESPQSQLAVTSKVRAQPPPPHLLSLPTMVGILMLIVLYKLMLLVCVMVHRKWTKA